MIFVISGLLKGVNIGSFSQLIREYIAIAGFHIFEGYGIHIAIIVCAGEIFLGLIAMSRYCLRFVWCFFPMILTFFTWLTYINLTDTYGGIESCGCFGELIHLNPEESFYKNLILLILSSIMGTAYLLRNRHENQSAMQVPVKYILGSAVTAICMPLCSVLLIDRIDPMTYLAIYTMACFIGIFTCMWICHSAFIIKICLAMKKIFIKYTYIFIMVLAVVLSSCQDRLETALHMAGDNREEMEKVLCHFKDHPDPLRYKAARFLIENMPYHFSLSGDCINLYDSAYLKISSEPIQTRNEMFKQLTDSIDFSSQTINVDIRSMDARSLIRIIDNACDLWHEVSWDKYYSEDLFFDYVLPYRILNERPSAWHETIDSEFPYLRSKEIWSKRGLTMEAENANITSSRIEDTESASKGKMVSLYNKDSKVSFQINVPIRTRKNVFLRYTSVDRGGYAIINLNGKHAGVIRLDPTNSLKVFRDSRIGVPLDLPPGKNMVSVEYGNSTIGLDYIQLSAIEPADTGSIEDFSRGIYRIYNKQSGKSIAIKPREEGLLKEIRLTDDNLPSDSTTSLRLDYRGLACWSISPLRKDSVEQCLEVRYCLTEENAAVSQYDYLNGSHQKWVILPDGNNYFRIMSKDSGLFLEALDTDDSSEVLVQTLYGGRDSQKWRIERIGDNPSPKKLFTIGDPISEALKIFDVTGQFEWIAYNGNIPQKASSLLKGKTGNCRDESVFTVYLCRHIGIPAAVDYTPHWGNRSQSHSWSVLIKPDGTSVPFYMGCAPGDTVHYYHSYLKPKIFRHRFRLNREIEHDMRGEKEIPHLFRHADFIDVTDEYYTTTDIVSKVPENLSDRNVAYICVFDNREWVPVYYGNISDGKVTFRSMGRNIMYIAAIYERGRIRPFGNPFLVNSDGTVTDIIPDNGRRQDMKLLRKYPFMGRQDHFNGRMSGGKFQGAYKEDFSDAITIYEHDGITEGNWYDVHVPDKGKFRLFRYLGPKGSYCNINEIEVYSSEGEQIKGKIIGTKGEAGKTADKVFDGDILTGFHAESPDGNWVGLRFERQTGIGRIRYIPRNDGNGIEMGDRYELIYWHDNDWVSLGIKTAQANEIIFKNMPMGGLYVLRNLTKGHEERIFTYENNQQKWW